MTAPSLAPGVAERHAIDGLVSRFHDKPGALLTVLERIQELKVRRTAFIAPGEHSSAFVHLAEYCSYGTEFCSHGA